MRNTILTLGFLFAFIPATTLAAFSDVSSSHIHAEAILYVQSEGIVSGNPDGTYTPDVAITRAAFTKIIVESLGLDTENLCRIAAFPDVSSDQWYYKYVMAARCAGLIAGYPDGTFKPGASINFVEMAKIVAEAFNLHATTDTEIWYKGYVLALEDRGAIPVQITAFNDVITRGEMAEVVYRLHGSVYGKSSTTYAELSGEVHVEGEGSIDFNEEEFEDDFDFDDFNFDDESEGFDENEFEF